MRSVRKRVVPAVAGLAAAMVLVAQQGAAAEPRPTAAQARARLAKLEDQADKTVERYNTVAERYKGAKKRYDALDRELSRERGKVDTLRADIGSTAAHLYQSNGVTTGLPGMLSWQDPSGVLAGLAVADQMSAGQANAMAAFEAATRGLRARHAKAKAAYDDVAELLGDVGDERKRVEKLVGEQERLLRRLNQFNAGDPNSRGIRYDGPASGNARTALTFAFAQAGKPYRYGATGPGAYDCSGFAQAAWAKAGVKLPRTTYQQWAWGAKRRVPMDKLQPGDLIFSNGLGHMGIYAGNGKMIHAPRTGDVVKVVTLASYGRGRFVGAVRP
ncbi:C40 family peptidase [Sphaerisporangium rufum]|uniref:C40 family peptidase n=1 Tax=Sphaerisporangium rufum TaxID=1381558 RepID=UPI001EF3394A|nr:C40 family peptidase [Sphaerisporangium rufum]